MKIKLQYQVKSREFRMFSVERFEARELIHECDPKKTDRGNIDDAFAKACELGAEPFKQVRWRFIEN